MEDNIKITCDNCTYSENRITNQNWICPKCGEKQCTIKMSLSDEVNLNIHESLSGKIYNPTKRKEQGKTGKSAKKPIQEFFDGDDYSHKLKKHVDKKRNIDRENDLYHEIVTDKESGEIIHEQQEKLSDHFGHGSDKNKKKL